MDLEDYHFKFKIVLLGDKGVGKSSFLDSITNNFGKVVESEISDELSLKTVAYMDDNTLYKIQYWEIPGHHKNNGYFFRYCLGSSAAIYFFDSNNFISYKLIAIRLVI